jgi:hypothetical protein
MSSSTNTNIPSAKTMKLIAEMVVLRSNSVDVTFLIRLFKTIHSNPAARTVILARITKRFGDELKWFIKWLWNAQKGKISDIEMQIENIQNKNLNSEIYSELKASIDSVDKIKKIYTLEKEKMNNNSSKIIDENSLKSKSETLLKLIISFVPTTTIKDIIILINEYAKEIIDSTKFQEKLNTICRRQPNVMIHILDLFDIKLESKIKYDLNRRQYSQEIVLETLIAEIQRYFDSCMKWIEDDNSRKTQIFESNQLYNNTISSMQSSTPYLTSTSNSTSIHRPSKLWLPTHVHHITIRTHTPIHTHIHHTYDNNNYNNIDNYTYKSNHNNNHHHNNSIPFQDITSLNRTLFLSGLDPSVENNDIINAFSRCGNIILCDIKRIGIAEGSEQIVINKDIHNNQFNQYNEIQTMNAASLLDRETLSSTSDIDGICNDHDITYSNPIENFTALKIKKPSRRVSTRKNLAQV